VLSFEIRQRDSSVQLEASKKSLKLNDFENVDIESGIQDTRIAMHFYFEINCHL